ncbi:MAG: hypothetical protein HKP39_10035 [Eudoraea sp.]|nr:hypothetical protein [Eudoraea sp.]
MKRRNLPKVFIFIILLTFFLISCKPGTENDKKDISNLHLPDINLLYEDYEQLDSTGAFNSFANTLVNANRDLNSSELYVEAASLYAQAGQSDSAAILLHKAIDNGMANPKIITKLHGLRNSDSPLWQKLQRRLDSINLELQDVSHYSMEIASMNQFWDYFERAAKDTSSAKDIFKEFIFEGPKELRDFYVVRYINLNTMYGQMINASPEYFHYLKNQFNPDSIEAFKSKTTRWMRNFKKIYPKAVFPKVYVVPGILNSGGTATEMGLFVGGDMYGRSETMPTDGLTNWQKDAIMKVSDLPAITIHELMHFQQNYQDTENNETVLAQVISEGVCDFLVELCSGKELKNSNLTYLDDQENEHKIMEDLKNDLFSEDNSKWLYNGGSITDRPHDLGYTVGYLICKSYYNNSPDKKNAVFELLNTNDFLTILGGSDYSFLLEKDL